LIFLGINILNFAHQSFLDFSAFIVPQCNSIIFLHKYNHIHIQIDLHCHVEYFSKIFFSSQYLNHFQLSSILITILSPFIFAITNISGVLLSTNFIALFNKFEIT
jgi:hypothetical protein